MSNEHPIEQPISYIEINHDEYFRVGYAGVTRIEAVEKSGMYSNIPYVRVFKGDVCVGEFCQHNIIGVYFDESSTDDGLTDDEREIKRYREMQVAHYVNGMCTTCEMPTPKCECIPF